MIRMFLEGNAIGGYKGVNKRSKVNIIFTMLDVAPVELKSNTMTFLSSNNCFHP